MSDADDRLDRISNRLHGDPTPMVPRAQYVASLQAEVRSLEELRVTLNATIGAQQSLLKAIRDKLLYNDGKLGVSLWQELCNATDGGQEP